MRVAGVGKEMKGHYEICMVTMVVRCAREASWDGIVQQ